MAGATRLQVWPRGIAAITAVWLVVCGMLAARHEASAAHVRDRAGSYVHAALLVGHHRGDCTDLHGTRNPEADRGECALLTAFHQAGSAHVAIIALVGTAHAAQVPDALYAAPPAVTAGLFRLAPKTSPPVAAA